MSDTYAITIEAIQASAVRVRVHLLNLPYPEVPANPCLAPQMWAEAAAIDEAGSPDLPPLPRPGHQSTA